MPILLWGLIDLPVTAVKVLDGLYAYLTADSTFNTAIGGGVATAGRLCYGHAERDTTLPFTVYQIVSSVDGDTMQKDGYDYRVQITAYEDVEAGARAVLDIMDKLRARLHRQRFTVTDHQQMTVSEDTVRGPFREDDAWRIDADYLVKGFET